MQDLGTLGGQQSDAWDVSADGTVVVGRAQDSSNQWRAFIWREGIGMQALPTPSGWSASVAYALAADGTIVGTALDASGQWHATRWTTNGFENLNQTYALLLGGSRLIEARDISANGRYIVGTGYNAATGREEAFLLDTRCTAHNGDVDNNGCIDDADLLAVLFAFGNTGSNLVRVDVNCDGVVDDADLLIVLFNFGSGC
jgi:probable HAF family extracellular repeat protein